MIIIDLAENFQISSAALVAGGVSFSAAVLIILTQFWHGRYTTDPTLGVQKIHVIDTPRVGGLAIYLAVWVGYWHTQSNYAQTLCQILLAAAPAFLFGLLEDVTRRVSVLMRLAATLLSGLIGIYVMGYTLTSLDIYLVDQLFEVIVIASYLFTIFAVAGVANAFNVIDGSNGLSSGLGMSGLMGIMLLAYHCGDVELVWVTSILLCAVAGFFIVNWPWGKLFLGDGGSYLLGFVFAWLGVMLVERNDDLTPFCVLLLAMYPVMEVVYTIGRRLKAKRPVGCPDALHFHSLLQKALSLRLSATPLQTNSLTGSMIVGFHVLSLPAILYVHEWPLVCMGMILAYGLLYHGVYTYLLNYVSKRSLVN